MKKTRTLDEDSSPSIKISRNRGSGKKRADLFARLRNTEHPLDNIFPDEPSEAPPHEIQPDPTAPYPTLPQTTVSPNKNFTKFSNSLLKQAIPEGLFRGQSKHTYDVLYLRTRGAINPVREIQLTKIQLVKLTGLEIKTIQRHLSFLRKNGLITVNPKIGDHKGAIYTVNIPEEMTLPDPTLAQASVVETSVGESSANSTPHPSINSTTVGSGNRPDNKEVTDDLNTSLKTNTKSDDEAFEDFIEKFQTASKEITGKKLSSRESEGLGKLADLLILEFKIAARRTSGISSVPAFLTEVLRRKLRDTPTQAKTSKDTADIIGKTESSNVYEIKPLDKESREVTLAQLREFAEDELLKDFKKWYTDEDWKWIIEQLKKRPQ